MKERKKLNPAVNDPRAGAAVNEAGALMKVRSRGIARPVTQKGKERRNGAAHRSGSTGTNECARKPRRPPIPARYQRLTAAPVPSPTPGCSRGRPAAERHIAGRLTGFAAGRA